MSDVARAIVDLSRLPESTRWKQLRRHARKEPGSTGVRFHLWHETEPWWATRNRAALAEPVGKNTTRRSGAHNHIVSNGFIVHCGPLCRVHYP